MERSLSDTIYSGQEVVWRLGGPSRDVIARSTLHPLHFPMEHNRWEDVECGNEKSVSFDIGSRVER